MKLLPAFTVTGAFLPINGHAPVHLLRGVFKNEFRTFSGGRVTVVDHRVDPMTEKYGYHMYAFCARCGRYAERYFKVGRYNRCERCVRLCERDCAHDMTEGGYNK